MSHATRYGSIFLVVLLATTRGAVAQPSPIDLGTLGGKNSYAIAVNDRGHVVGESQTATNDIHAFFWSTTEGMVDLGTLGGWRSRPLAINNNDEVVGWSTTTAGGDRAFRSCGPTTAGWWTWVDERHPVGGGPQGRPCAATKSWIPSRRFARTTAIRRHMRLRPE